MSGIGVYNTSWPPFNYQGVVYDLSHLDSFVFSIEDSKKVERNILVVFGDHCFTRKPKDGDSPALEYPASDRLPGYFCFERYRLSFGIVSMIQQASIGKVWLMENENFAIIHLVDDAGNEVKYCIVFSLDLVKGIGSDLIMRVRSAHPRNTGDYPETYGETRFKHLVSLRLQRKMPAKNTNSGRDRPRV